VAAAAAVFALGARSFAAAEDWRTETTLWEATAVAAPDNPTPHFLAARRAIDEGRLEEGERLLDRVLELWPDTSAALYEKGVLRARRGDLEAAADLFRRAVRLNPWHGRAQADLGIALHRLGRVEEAERRLRYAQRQFPELEGPVSELAALCFADGRYAEAAVLYGRAVALGRTDLEPAREEARRRAAAGEVPPRR
jgi:Flp pilus assembly protein TadD